MCAVPKTMIGNVQGYPTLKNVKEMQDFIVMLGVL